MTADDNVACAARAFCVDGQLKSAVAYGSGHIHSTYSIQCEGHSGSGHIMLQRINTSIFRNPVAMMENIERVTKHVQSRLDGAPDAERRVLRLVRARDGKPWHVDARENYWRAYRFIEGACTFDQAGSPEQAFEAAKAFGSFQQMLINLPGERLAETIPDFHYTPKRFADFDWAVNRDEARRGNQAQHEIAFAISRRAIAGLLVDTGLPERVTHNDTKLNNVLLDERTGTGLCVIDLDTVMPGLAAYDFGDMVRTMTCWAAEDERDLTTVEMRFPLFEAVLRGYLDGAGDFLTSEERETLVAGAKVIVFEQGIRFLADFLNGDKYYKVSRPAQNLDRCRTQFRLLESIEQQESAMVRLLRKVR